MLEREKSNILFQKTLYLVQYFSKWSIWPVFDHGKCINFADDNTLYMSPNNITNLVENLEDSVRCVFKWFANNQMQGNWIKCHILLSKKEIVFTIWNISINLLILRSSYFINIQHIEKSWLLSSYHVWTIQLAKSSQNHYRPINSKFWWYYCSRK